MNGRIRILHLFYSYLNTTENWAFRLIDNLPDTDVVIASREFRKCNFFSDKFEYLEFPMKSIEQNRGLLPVRLFNSLVSKLMRLYPWYVEKMVGRIDLVHSHFSMVGWEYRDLARRLKIPHVVSFYGFDYENLPHTNPEWRDHYRILFREADLFLCEGGHGAHTLEKMGCPADKIRIAKLGVEIEKIPSWVRVKRTGELKLLQIATFVEKKGHVYTVKAFIEALRECPNMTLTLVGGDPLGIKKELRQMIQGSRAEGRVTFVDHIDFSKLHAFLSDYQVFIHPSCYSREMDCEGGAPIIILDAQASGMPVLSTLHCDIPEEVIDGETGILVNEGDSDALADAIKTFYRMEEITYQGYCKSARKHVEQNYDAVKCAAELKKMYEAVIA